MNQKIELKPCPFCGETAFLQVDGEPVKHGKWDEISSVKHIGKCTVPISKCSCCGFLFCDIFNRSDLYNYCPNCGARMDAADEVKGLIEDGNEMDTVQ